ncbi:hypothetical protein SAY87_030858 [Trapa incisa]|uniref:Uncharacterized protein n=1 Tax=Trapa incisa TaxID=236973 RepID=A0AAN7QKP4_9MYRT|nr:hypothetical protein SAY87_030858 [Trapa incisa]
MMNPRTDKLVRRVTMVATATASYFLLTADYGPEPNALDPIKNAILSAQDRAKGLVLGPSRKTGENRMGSMGSNNSNEQP